MGKKGRSGKENKKERELGDTYNKSQIWADAPHCRVPTLATQRTYTLYTPCDITMTERGVMCIVRWLDGGYYDAKHACEFVSFHISKVTCWGRALILHLERAREKQRDRQNRYRKRETGTQRERNMHEAGESPSNKGQKQQSGNLFFDDKHSCRHFGCWTTVLRHFEVEVNRSNELIFLAEFINKHSLYTLTHTY